jgi:anthranilate synthase component 2
MIVMIDNYDSFTYNLVQYIQILDGEVMVFRNDETTVENVAALNPRCIVISPGPCTPHEAGISIDVVKNLSGKIPILGICLGHQSIGAAFGAEIVGAKHLMHGKTSEIEHNGEDVFKGIRSPLTAIRYHSLAIRRATCPDCLEITATADDGEIMGVRHREHMTHGVQFHPESILTTCGKRLLGNFLRMTE